MNSFQILDKDNNAISIKQLDQEACEFWGKTIDPKWYAEPNDKIQGNWFDVIGWKIANQGNYCSGWTNIVHTMIAESIGTKFIDFSEGYKERPIKVVEFKEQEISIKNPNQQIAMQEDEYIDKTVYHLPDKIEESIMGVLQYYKPYIELINHWKSKGYQPKQIKE